MVDVLHIPIRNGKKKPFAIALNGVGMGMWGTSNGGELTNVQYKPICNCHSEFPLYNEHTVIKI
jgi:alpha-L-arabinofuranosidase